MATSSSSERASEAAQPPQPTETLPPSQESPAQAQPQSAAQPRRYLVETTGPVAVIQLYADGFEALTPRERVLAYHLAEAGIAGDPIYYDQVSDYGLALKRLLEGIWTHPQGIAHATLAKIRDYTKQVWIHHGNYNHDSARKFLPEFTPEELREAAAEAQKNGANLLSGPSAGSQAQLDALLQKLQRPIFDLEYKTFLTAKTPPTGQDVITASGSNLYVGITREEAEQAPERYPINSRTVKRDGRVIEEVYRTGTPDGSVPAGLYAEYLRNVVAHLEKAAAVADPAQAGVLQKLIRYYQTGEKSDWYAYNIAWVKLSSNVDAINGFIESYIDPLGAKSAFESVVSFVDVAQTRLMRTFADNAQYFESRAPWLDIYKKEDVHPPVANVITVISEAGEGGPISSAGINLPNEQDIRQQHGSKSVLLFNVTGAMAEASGQKSALEFSASPEEAARAAKFGLHARQLLIAMHEVLGHGSGKVNPGLTADPRSYLKEYYSTLEEARADLVALWDFGDTKLEALGIADREELMRAAYDAEVRASLTLLYRYPHGEQVEEDHDRGTQMIVTWLRENAHCIETIQRDVSHSSSKNIYLRVTNYEKMHQGVGRLLAELMRIKAEGDYEAIKALVNTHGVKLNPDWRDNIQERGKRINLPARGAFLSPIVEPVQDANGNVVDATLRYSLSLQETMLEYSRKSLSHLHSQT